MTSGSHVPCDKLLLDRIVGDAFGLKLTDHSGSRLPPSEGKRPSGELHEHPSLSGSRLELHIVLLAGLIRLAQDLLCPPVSAPVGWHLHSALQQILTLKLTYHVYDDVPSVMHRQPGQA